MYHKPTFTGVYLNWTSLTAIRYKLGAIKCHAERIWRICSDHEDRLNQIEKLKGILYMNDYPVDVVERTLNKFLESKASPPLPKETEVRKKRYLKLPYVSSECDSYAHELKKHVEHFYPQILFNVAWEAPMKVASFFPFKDRIKDIKDRVLVVYSIRCKTCNAEYVGKTKRALGIRLEEHKSKSQSACYKHMMENTDHEMAFEDVTIIDSADNDDKLKYKELLHILDRKRVLNNQLGSQSKYETKTLIITKYMQFRAEK